MGRGAGHALPGAVEGDGSPGGVPEDVGFKGEALTAVRSKCICPRLHIRHLWGKIGRSVWGLRPSWYKLGSGKVLGSPGSPKGGQALHFGERQPFHFEDANESTDVSLIYPGSCLLGNSP